MSLVSDFDFKNRRSDQWSVAKIFSVCVCVREKHWEMKDKMEEGDVQNKKSYFTD